MVCGAFWKMQASALIFTLSRARSTIIDPMSLKMNCDCPAISVRSPCKVPVPCRMFTSRSRLL